MFYRIIARNAAHTLAFVEPVSNVQPAPKDIYCLVPDPVYFIDPKGNRHTCDRSDIVTDPAIISVFLPGRCYKINLEV